jgi:hypothetical protein
LVIGLGVETVSGITAEGSASGIIAVKTDRGS